MNFEIHFIPRILVNVRRGTHNSLTCDWRRVFKGHRDVVWKHRSLYREYGGNLAVCRQIGKHFCHAGDKRGRVLGRFLKLIGVMLGGKRPSIIER